MTQVSFMIPVYNKAAYVGDMLQSILNQTGGFEREIICINDGSTDGSRDVLQEWAQRYPNIHLIDQENQGPSIAANRGFAQAQGDYIRCIDADDLLHPQATEIMLRTLEHTQAEAVACGQIRAKTSRDVPAVWQAMLQHDLCKEEVHPLTWDRGYIRTLPLLLFSRKTGTQIHGCDSRIFTQDYYIALKLVLYRPCVLIPSPLYLYRKDQNDQLSKNDTQAKHDTILAEAYIIHEDPNIPLAFKQRSLQRAWRHLGRLYKKHNHVTLWIRAQIQRAVISCFSGTLPHDTAPILFNICEIFRHYAPIRLTEAGQISLEERLEKAAVLP